MTRDLTARIKRLESMVPPKDWGRPFLWGPGVPLAGALNDAGLTLDDKPLLAIRLVGVHPGETEPRPDPVHERDMHLLD
jgi:hypothetical protein